MHKPAARFRAGAAMRTLRLLNAAPRDPLLAKQQVLLEPPGSAAQAQRRRGAWTSAHP